MATAMATAIKKAQTRTGERKSKREKLSAALKAKQAAWDVNKERYKGRRPGSKNKKKRRTIKRTDSALALSTVAAKPPVKSSSNPYGNTSISVWVPKDLQVQLSALARSAGVKVSTLAGVFIRAGVEDAQARVQTAIFNGEAPKRKRARKAGQ